MSIRKFAAVALVLAGLAACTATTSSGGGGGINPDAGGGGLHANSYGYGDRYYQMGRD
jgi:hypothetical protein